MIDPTEPSSFESDLRQFFPAMPSPNLRAQIESALATNTYHPAPSIAKPRLSLSDRCLVTAISLGAAAGVLILTLLATDFLNSSSAPSTSAIAAGPADSPVLAKNRQLLAQLAAGNDPFADHVPQSASGRRGGGVRQ